MKKLFWASAILAFLFPLSFAFAEVHAGVSGEVRLEDHESGFNAGLHSTTTVDADEHASSTPWMHGEKEGLKKHFGTTTPPGFMRDHEKEGTSTDEDATSTEKHENKGLHVGGLPGFLRWLFGLPATTTIGELRTQIEASTTASSTSSHGEGLGFFARLFSFFHFGK